MRLNEWVQKPNKSGTAYLARGMYFWNLGWKTRGFEYATETPNERIQGMKEYFSLGWQDLHMATRQKPKSGIPYAFIISIAMSLGDKKGVNHYTQKGLETDPRSFVVRWKHLWSLTPWWSGLSTKDSVEASQIFLQSETIPRVEDNPALRPLLGFPDFIRAEMLKRNGQREQAIPYYEATLRHGKYYYYTFRLGQNLFFLDQNVKALNAFTTSLKERPQVAEVYDYRARALANLDRLEEALTDQPHAIALDALDPGNLRRYAWRLHQLHHVEEAKQALTQALTYGSYDHAVLGNLGRLYLADLHDPEKALPYLKKAVWFKPDKGWYQLHYGWALSALKDCQAVDAFQHYKTTCWISGSCNPEQLEWAKKTSQRMIWKEGCWREHPTLKLLGRLVKWLPKL